MISDGPVILIIQKIDVDFSGNCEKPDGPVQSYYTLNMYVFDLSKFRICVCVFILTRLAMRSTATAELYIYI